MAEPCTRDKDINFLMKEVDENKKRLHAGDLVLQDIKSELKTGNEIQKNTSEQTQKIFDRMFVDNGKKSFQSVLATTSTHIRIQWFLLGAILVALLTAMIKHFVF